MDADSITLSPRYSISITSLYVQIVVPLYISSSLTTTRTGIRQQESPSVLFYGSGWWTSGRYRNERRFAKVSTSQIRADYFGFRRDERGEMINSSKEYFKLDLCLYYYITVHVATTERNSHPDIVWGILYIICNSLVHITTLTTPF